MPAAPLGVFGGTFDPVHIGHLRTAVELRESLGLEAVRFMPAAQPPHRDAPGVLPEHRAAMVELAVAGVPGLSCDRRELARSGPSYSVDSLTELREELGARRGLCLIVGSDALAGLPHWHRWEALIDLCHIVCVARPGWEWPRAEPLAGWLRARITEEPQQLSRRAAGCVFAARLRPLPVAATELRALLQSGRSARYLVPDTVLDYIECHGLYGAPGPEELHGGA